MSTLATMRSRIADYVNRADINSQITTEINRAIEHYYNQESFWFTETTGTFSTVASQESYGTADGLPSDIQDIYYASIVVTSTNYQELTQRSINWIEETNIGRATGTPSDWAWYQNKIYLYLIPNAVLTINLYYRKSYSALSADSDTNDFTTYAEDLIEAHASAAIYEGLLKDFDSADRSKLKAQTALMALRAISDAKKSTNSISATSF